MSKKFIIKDLIKISNAADFSTRSENLTSTREKLNPVRVAYTPANIRCRYLIITRPQKDVLSLKNPTKRYICTPNL